LVSMPCQSPPFCCADGTPRMWACHQAMKKSPRPIQGLHCEHGDTIDRLTAQASACGSSFQGSPCPRCPARPMTASRRRRSCWKRIENELLQSWAGLRPIPVSRRGFTSQWPAVWRRFRVEILGQALCSFERLAHGVVTPCEDWRVGNAARFINVAVPHNAAFGQPCQCALACRRRGRRR